MNADSYKVLAGSAAQRIRSAAVLEFGERGFGGARVARIATAAGANKQLVYYYYHSKRGLHKAAIEWATSTLGDLVQRISLAAPTSAGRLGELAAGLFDLLVARPHLVALLTREATAHGAPGTLAPAINRLVAVIAEGQGRGEFRHDLDPHLLAAQAMVLILGFLQFDPVLAASAIPLGMDGSGLGDRWRDGLVALVLRGAVSGPL